MDDTLASAEHCADFALDQRLARLRPAQRALLDQRLHQEPVSGHSLVARTLAGLGVTHLYGVPGQPTYDTFSACVKESIRVIGARHQQPAALMAAAHNYFAGQQKAVSVVSTGVPTANALSAVVVAHDNCWPLVVLAGAVPLSASGTGYFMALNGVELYRPVTKWATRVLETRAIPACIAQAFEVAMNGRPGPVLVELPEDILTGLADGCDTLQTGKTSQDKPVLDPSVLQRVVAALIRSERPLLIIGKGVRWGAAYDELRQLVDGLSLPFVTSPIGRGAIPDNHALCMNAITHVAQSQADLVLLLGARLDWTFRYGCQLTSKATVIQVDIHAAEFGRNRTIELGVHADAGVFLRSMVREIGQAERSKARTRRDHAWIGALHELRQEVLAKREARASNEGSLISPLRLAKEVHVALPRDAITIFDGNLTMAACEQMIPAHAPVSRLTPGTSGCMGVGIPYAIAAKLAHPERPVVAICDDFAFGLSVMELETAVRHNVPVVIVIANNDGNGGSLRQRMHMPNASAERIMMSQSSLRYDRIGEVFGAYAAHVQHARDIGPALARAIASNRLACINIAIDPDADFPAD